MEVDNGIFFAEVTQLIGQGKQVRIPAKGMSMLPLIRHLKDTITLVPLSIATLQVGDLVLARLQNNNYVLHRISHIEGRQVTLRGDGNPYQREHCTLEDLIAEATEVSKGRYTIKKGDCTWWVIQHLWPRHGLIRRVLLYPLRRMM